MTRKTKGAPDEIDMHAGQRLRAAREMARMSQEKLAEREGITFQQIQKYEKGINRMSAGRLWSFAKILSVPIDFFFPQRDHYNLIDARYEDLKHDSKKLEKIRKILEE